MRLRETRWICARSVSKPRRMSPSRAIGDEGAVVGKLAFHVLRHGDLQVHVAVGVVVHGTQQLQRDQMARWGG